MPQNVRHPRHDVSSLSTSIESARRDGSFVDSNPSVLPSRSYTLNDVSVASRSSKYSDDHFTSRHPPHVLSNAQGKPPSAADNSFSRETGKQANPAALPAQDLTRSSRDSPRGRHVERRNSSKSKSSRVEKSIEASLTNVEPSANVRSRKSSHYLGLFKENTGSPERKKREDRARDQILEEPEDIAQDKVLPSKERSPLPTTVEGSLELDASLSLPQPDVSSSATFQEPEKNDRISQGHKGEVFNLARYTEARLASPIPPELLTEIKGHHTLLETPGLATSRFNSFPTSTLPGEKKNEALYATDGTLENQMPVSNDGQQRYIRSESEGLEDEDDDKERISSALYFPHQRPLEDEDSSSPPDNELSDGTTKQRNLEKSAALPRRKEQFAQPDGELGGRVDISLLSNNESRILQGDIRPTRLSRTDASESLTAISELTIESFSESESVSADESVSVQGDDVSLIDEFGTTPTAITSLQRTSPQKSSRHTRTPTAPLGAVELKPYRHQVGGHTTVFRFSRRAVCKQLNNRENQFYERIERRHPEMLIFLARLVKNPIRFQGSNTHTHTQKLTSPFFSKQIHRCPECYLLQGPETCEEKA